MSEAVQTMVSANFEKLKGKLRELFELDKADLDFGIYRVLRQRHAEITEFLDQHLEKTVREALQSHQTLHTANIEEELGKAEKAAQAAGISPEQSPRVMELRAKLKGEGDLAALADEVYSHLLTFFSRYYEGGDFLGLHRSTVQGREKYMIPYNGEEVKLIWANMDQYYIKSSELLRDYTFHIRKDDLGPSELNLGDLPGEATIQFKLIEGDTEKDNRKPDGKTTRAFTLDAEQPWEEEGNNLRLRFRYREHVSERNLQDKLNADTVKTIADNLPQKWKTFLFAQDNTYKSKDKKETRTILQKQLRAYTAKYFFDYFIHKDLGGFLKRELDFYIKNEVMHLDDIENSTAPKAEEYLSKVRAIRRCAMPIIRMLAQLEDFQKKLWLKKKFVVETRYCLTLDRVFEALYPDICACDAQWEEWNDLFALSEVNPQRTADFLQANPQLIVDTRHFDRVFTLKLLGTIEDLDTTLDGVCFHSENFQALQFMRERYREEVKCVYIDPPYNTAASEILYKNNYKSSSWLTMVGQSLPHGRQLLTEDGIFCATIDDEQQKEFTTLLSYHFGSENALGVVCIRINPSGRITLRGFAQAHEYAIFLGASDEAVIAKLPRTEEQQARFNREDEGGDFEWRNFRREGSSSERVARPRRFFPLYVKGSSIRIPKLQWVESKRAYDVLEEPQSEEEVIYPIDSKGADRVWRWGLERISAQGQEIVPKRKANGDLQVYYKYRPNTAGVLPLTVWIDKKYSATEYGTAMLKSLFGDRNVFDFPKSIFAVTGCVRVGGAVQSDATVLDYFGGSGTTGHAVINLNRDDDGNRRYLLVEIDEHFDSVLVPRLKKVAYSTDWKEGKPQTRNTGISHAFKIVRLESYEDALNNLYLRRTPEQEAALQRADDRQRKEYWLGYFLDVESAGNKSLLDLTEFRDPFGYKLQVATSSAGETKETEVDLVETFNWLIGLKVKHIDHQKGFLTVTGEKRAGGRTLILWRTLSDEARTDNIALEKFLAKLQVNPADTEFDFIYLNGSYTLNDPHNKVHLIEEEFQRRMFESETFESLS